MEWDEIKMRLRDGASVQILADLEGVPYKTMYNRIKQHELKDGKVYMKPTALRASRQKRTKYKKPEVIEPKPEEVRPDFVLHPSPESVEAIDKVEEKLQEARDKMTYAFSQLRKKISERLQETIPAPEVEKIRVIEEKAKEPEEEKQGGSPEVLSSVADRIIDELDERIDLLNDELQKLEDKKLELLYEAGIWKNILAALKRERGEA